MESVHWSTIWNNHLAGRRLCQQNGSFKMVMVQAKSNLLRERLDFMVEKSEEKSEVVLLIHHTWKESFATVERNKKVIAERGWAPVNYVLSDHLN